MEKYKEIFEQNKDLSEDEIVMAIYNGSDGELSIKEAQSTYHNLATAAGLIKTPAQKKVDFEDSLEESNIDLTTAEGLKEAKALGAEKNIGTTTVTKYIKDYAAERDIELPSGPTRAPSKWNDIVAGFTKDEALDGDKDEVIAKINELGELGDAKKATAMYNKLRKHFGWSAPESMVTQLCNWFVDNPDSDQDAIAEKAKEIGMSDRSIQYYKGVFRIVKDIVKKID